MQHVSAVVRGLRRHKEFHGVLTLWGVGDIVNVLRSAADIGGWGKLLEQFGSMTGMHPERLMDAARAASAFPAVGRDLLLRRFDEAGAVLTPSHVIELARATRGKRELGLELLLSTELSIRELRTRLRAVRVVRDDAA